MLCLAWVGLSIDLKARSKGSESGFFPRDDTAHVDYEF